MKRLNLGCGENKMNDYINVDIRPEINPDIVWDLEKFPYPWEDSSIDEIYASNVIEHFPYQIQDTILEEWHRILKSGGKLIIICPDIERLFNIYISSNESGGPFGHPHAFLEHFIFGGQNHDNDFHKSGYTLSLMKYRLTKAGFTIVSIDGGINVEATKS